MQTLCSHGKQNEINSNKIKQIPTNKNVWLIFKINILEILSFRKGHLTYKLYSKTIPVLRLSIKDWRIMVTVRSVTSCDLSGFQRIVCYKFSKIDDISFLNKIALKLWEIKKFLFSALYWWGPEVPNYSLQLKIWERRLIDLKIFE